MVRLLALRIFIALQLLMVLAWPTQASTVEDLQHRALHTVLAQHGHDSEAHLDHEADHDHDHDAQLSQPINSNDATGKTAADHHHHDFNVSVALLPQHLESIAAYHGIQNPRILPAMHSAEQRLHLRPPQV
jgi:ABC-type Zn2+ transport system substrate-binding protein/surface adhesin